MPLNPLPSFDLSGKVALVTGGSRGLGREIVAGFAQAGADVMIASRNAENCAVFAQEIAAATGRRAVPCGVHVGRWDELVEAAYATFGHVDILVNNAGMSPLYDSVETVSEDLFDKVIAVNLKGPFRLAALVGTRMAAGSGGSIINITSAAAVRPRPDVLPYSAAKAGLNALTVGLARAFGPAVRCKGARRINLWHPGGVVITPDRSRIRLSRCSSSRHGSRGGAGGGPPMPASPCRRS